MYAKRRRVRASAKVNDGGERRGSSRGLERRVETSLLRGQEFGSSRVYTQSAERLHTL